jgi:hypothetical protein
LAGHFAEHRERRSLPQTALAHRQDRELELAPQAEDRELELAPTGCGKLVA